MSAANAIPAQIAFLPDGADLRQVRRRAVNFAAFVDMEGVSTEPVQVLDISERGCRIGLPGEAQPGATLLVKVPGLEAVRAKIVWCSDQQAGCEFEEELHPASLELLTSTGERTPRLPARRTVFGLKPTDG